MTLFVLCFPASGHLVAPYCAIPRDYLSDTPYCALWGFWCLNMANWVRYPLPLFWAFPPWRAWEVEVRYPPSKGVSQRYLRDTLWKQGNWVRYPPLRYYLERVLRDMGGISHWAAKSGHLKTPNTEKQGKTQNDKSTLCYPPTGYGLQGMDEGAEGICPTAPEITGTGVARKGHCILEKLPDNSNETP